MLNHMGHKRASTDLENKHRAKQQKQLSNCQKRQARCRETFNPFACSAVYCKQETIDLSPIAKHHAPEQGPA